MRFKAIVEQPAALIRMLTSLSHMTKDCLLILGNESWKFMINEKFVATAHPQCYATVPIAYAFSHYMIESQSDDEILLQINIKNLLAAFRSVKEFSGGMTILKLTKKNNIALLSFEMWQDDGNELKVNVIQDVSVKPIQHSKLYLYEEPALGEYHGSAILPKLKSIKTVIERMRIISNSVSSERANLYVNNNDGRLLLETKTDHCSLKTIYNGLAVNNRQLHDDQSSNARRNEYIRANIDLKYLLKVIQSLNPLTIKSTIIAITKRTCVTIHAHLVTHAGNINRNDDDDDSSLSRITFYLCVYLDDDDESDDDDEDEDEDEEEDEDDDDEKTMDATNDTDTNSNTNDIDI